MYINAPQALTVIIIIKTADVGMSRDPGRNGVSMVRSTWYISE